MANCKTIVAGELFQAARQRLKRLKRHTAVADSTGVSAESTGLVPKAPGLVWIAPTPGLVSIAPTLVPRANAAVAPAMARDEIVMP